MLIVQDLYDQWGDTHQSTGDPVVVMVGRVPCWDRWIKVVFEGTSFQTGRFETAYSDRRLEEIYGGRPWQNQAPTISPNQ